MPESNPSALKIAFGLLRSFGMYRAHPFRRRALAQFYASFIRPGDLCFDIGSHIGSHLDIFLNLGARVIALEPQPQCIRLLRRRYGRNRRAVLLEQAAAAEPGFRTLHVSQKAPTLSTLSEEWAAEIRTDPDFSGTHWDLRIPVRVTTLDSLIEEYGVPVFCKVDVEGGELEVLRGLSLPLRALSFEYIASLKERAFDCIGRLADLGDYEFNWTRGEGRPLESRAWLKRADIVAELMTFCPGRGSGDIYARTKIPKIVPRR
ncbi:MAG TPA: FkbM family methyltransferase [Thermodesulfobacteriota bacterium]|nr:FkbM family methyltransferase [Thermodesulfobacteriota bacterium]